MGKNVISSAFGGGEEGIKSTKGYCAGDIIFIPSFTNIKQAE